jgi:glutaredoxin
VVIFTTKACPYCRKAKGELAARQVPYREVGVDDAQLRTVLREVTGSRTVPQVGVGGGGGVVACLPVPCLRWGGAGPARLALAWGAMRRAASPLRSLRGAADLCERHPHWRQ